MAVSPTTFKAERLRVWQSSCTYTNCLGFAVRVAINCAVRASSTFVGTVRATPGSAVRTASASGCTVSAAASSGFAVRVATCSSVAVRAASATGSAIRSATAPSPSSMANVTPKHLSARHSSSRFSASFPLGRRSSHQSADYSRSEYDARFSPQKHRYHH